MYCVSLTCTKSFTHTKSTDWGSCTMSMYCGSLSVQSLVHTKSTDCGSLLVQCPCTVGPYLYKVCTKGPYLYSLCVVGSYLHTVPILLCAWPLARLPVLGFKASTQCHPSSSMAMKYVAYLLTLKRKRIQAFETKCLRELLCTSYMEQKTNDWVWSKINSLVGSQEPLLATVKRPKLAWFRHVAHHDSLSKTIVQGSLEGGQCHGLQKKCWMDNIEQWTSLPVPELLTRASCRKDWKRISAESSLMSPRPPIRSMDWTELNWTTCPSLHLPKTVRMLWDLTCLFGAFSWIDREKS